LGKKNLHFQWGGERRTGRSARRCTQSGGGRRLKNGIKTRCERSQPGQPGQPNGPSHRVGWHHFALLASAESKLDASRTRSRTLGLQDPDLWDTGSPDPKEPPTRERARISRWASDTLPPGVKKALKSLAKLTKRQ